MNAKLNKIRQLAPDMGAYMNEAHSYEPDWQRTFWGSHYPRLLNIKKEVDPTDVFWCPQCVGSEGWHNIDDRLCKF
jgi:berberine-like enzyme